MTPKPCAWLCEMVQEDGSIKSMFVEQDPAGLRFGDVGEPSPFRVTPLYDHPAVGAAAVATPCAWLTEPGRQALQDGDGPVRAMPAEDADIGFTVPAFDQSAIDAAVAAECERLADDLQTARDALQRASGWLHAAYDPPKTPECIAMLAEVAAARGMGVWK